MVKERAELGNGGAGVANEIRLATASIFFTADGERHLDWANTQNVFHSSILVFSTGYL